MRMLVGIFTAFIKSRSVLSAHSIELSGTFLRYNVHDLEHTDILFTPFVCSRNVSAFSYHNTVMPVCLRGGGGRSYAK